MKEHRNFIIGLIIVMIISAFSAQLINSYKIKRQNEVRLNSLSLTNSKPVPISETDTKPAIQDKSDDKPVTLFAPKKPPDITKYLLTKPIKLFSLQYGYKPDKLSINMMIKYDGPGDIELSHPIDDFTIGPNGDIYIVNSRNNKIKVFNRSGKFLFDIGSQFEHIYGESKIYVSKDLKIYVAYFDNSHFELSVYDKNCEIIQEETLRLNLTLQQSGMPIKDDCGRISYIKAFENGNVIIKYYTKTIHILLYDFRSNSWSEIKGIPYQEGTYYAPGKIDIQDCDVAETLCIDIVYNDLRKYKTYIPKHYILDIFDTSNNVNKTISIPNGEWSEVECLLPDLTSNFFQMEVYFIDDKGHFYVLREPLTTKRYAFKKNVENVITSYTAVLEYDELGNFVGVRAKFNTVDYLDIPPKVDSKGNVYWMEFQLDHMDFMMAPAPKK